MGPQFTPLSSILLNLTSAGSTGVQPSTGAVQALMLNNGSSAGAWIKIAASSTGIATIPTTTLAGAVADSVYVAPSSAPMIIAARPNCFISGLTTAAVAAQIRVTAGQFL